MTARAKLKRGVQSGAEYMCRLPCQRVGWLCRAFLNTLPGIYRPQAYWRHRLRKYEFDLRGVGHKGFSHQENERMYSTARSVFLELCREHCVDFGSAQMLDVGCGTGFYANAFQQASGQHYLGIDITDVLFAKLRAQFPGFDFMKLDITSQELCGTFDLVVMIDVTQHIVSPRKFSSAMQNIRSHLRQDGILVLTSWLSEKIIRRTYYEVARPLWLYKKEFPECEFSEPRKFRDKYIFSVRKQGQLGDSAGSKGG